MADLHCLNMFRRFAFNFWYFRKPPWDTGISPPELLDFLANHPAGRAIDIGCGTGTNVVTLAQHGWRVTGVDFAARAIQIAQTKVRRLGVDANLFVDDATKLRVVSGPFDLALDLGCFHGLRNKNMYLSQLDRILVKGGHWLMYGFFKEGGRQSGPGLIASDLDLILSHGFQLMTRKDGWDKRERPSAWFLYKRT